jgi:hypothetical protein
MFKTFIPVACLTAMLGFSAPSTAQLGDAAKQAGKTTVDVTKGAAKTTSEGAQKVGSSVKKGTEKGVTGTKNAVTGRPRGTTGQCKDGTYTAVQTRHSACSKHGGVEKWY